jgi:hypothetical protein
MGIDPDEVERLLDGTSNDPANAGLAELLRSAAGPARPRELAGEGRAVAGFRHQGYQRRGTKAAKGRKRRVGLFAGVVTAVLLAGGTTAAGAGRLPDPLQRAAHDWLSVVGVPDPEPTPSPTRAPASVRTSRAPSHPPSPSASAVRLADLCRLWREDKNHNLPGPQRRELADAAGGEDRIAGYCALHSGSGAPPSPPSSPPPSKDKPEKSPKPHK